MSNADLPAYPSRFGPNSPGLTKREAFALAAMQGFCANQSTTFTEASGRQIAEYAASHADALLAELEKGAAKP